MKILPGNQPNCESESEFTSKYKENARFYVRESEQNNHYKQLDRQIRIFYHQLYAA